MAANTLVSAYGAEPVTPSDTVSIPVTRAIYVGGTGNLAVTMLDGQVVTFSGVPAGTTLYIQVTKVMATSTSATLILALY